MYVKSYAGFVLFGMFVLRGKTSASAAAEKHATSRIDSEGIAVRCGVRQQHYSCSLNQVSNRHFRSLCFECAESIGTTARSHIEKWIHYTEEWRISVCRQLDHHKIRSLSRRTVSLFYETICYPRTETLISKVCCIEIGLENLVSSKRTLL